ncbi:MAG: hypothetical protein HYY40_11825 [Bacteroidetes bacterium]|nr:hypothetical protein [Bacteroidota bacterium]
MKTPVHPLHSFFLLLLLATSVSVAQQEGVSISSDDSPPDSSAMLDIKSNSKGLLIPRMDSASRMAIVNPAEGLMVYDNTSKSFYYFSIGQWIRLGTESTMWNLTGNNGTLSSLNFLGTTDAQDLVLRTNNLERMRILSNGLVGINMASPQHRLHIHSVETTGPLPAAHENCCERSEREVIDTILPPTPRPADGYYFATQQFTNSFTGSNINDGLLIGITGINGFLNLQEEGSLLFSAGGGTPMVLSSLGLGLGKGKPLAKFHIQVKDDTASFLKINTGKENIFEILNDYRIQVGSEPDTGSRFFISNGTYSNSLKVIGRTNRNAIFGFGEDSVRGVLGKSQNGEGIRGVGSTGVVGKAHDGGTGVKGVSTNGIAGHFKSTNGTALIAEDNTDNYALIIPPNNGKVGVGINNPTSRLHVKNTTGYNQFRLETPYKPANSSDPNGNIGDISWGEDGSNFYLYLKVDSTEWVRMKFNNW